MTEKRFMQHGKIIDIYFQHKQLAKITKLLLFIIDHGDTKVRYTGIFQCYGQSHQLKRKSAKIIRVVRGKK